MKIGILTFHNAHNWGAALQLYALKNYLISLGHEVKVINYRNENIEKSYPQKLNITLNKKDIKGILIYLYQKLELEFGKKAYKEKWTKFKKFEKELLDNDEKEYTLQELENLNIDAFICGSDQIWNPGLTGGLDKAYFCQFNTTANKITYAASMGVKKIDSKYEEQFEKYVNGLDYISVRENSLKEYLKKFTNKDIYEVVDPTLLLDVNKYKNIEVDPKYKNYLLVYTLMDNPILRETSKKIAKERNLKIVEICYLKELKKIFHKQIANIGPEEFIGLIKNANCVITNSFHGTIFSMLYRKDFYTINAGHVNSRIENLLKIANIQERCISDYEDIKKCSNIDYNTVFENISKHSLSSKEFLKKALQNDFKE